jgi:hypothetical protein
MKTKRTGMKADFTIRRQQLQRIRVQVYSQRILCVTALLFLVAAVLAVFSPASEELRILSFPLLSFGLHSVLKTLRELGNKPLLQDFQ